jgi:hypothetical protein
MNVYFDHSNDTPTVPVLILIWCCGCDIDGASSWRYGSFAMHVRTY